MILVATSGGKQVLTGMNKLIHPSAWKWNSANFVFTEFYEVGGTRSDSIATVGVKKCSIAAV
jgi:hypothetical protein